MLVQQEPQGAVPGLRSWRRGYPQHHSRLVEHWLDDDLLPVLGAVELLGGVRGHGVDPRPHWLYQRYLGLG